MHHFPVPFRTDLMMPYCSYKKSLLYSVTKIEVTNARIYCSKNLVSECLFKVQIVSEYDQEMQELQTYQGTKSRVTEPR